MTMYKPYLGFILVNVLCLMFRIVIVVSVHSVLLNSQQGSSSVGRFETGEPQTPDPYCHGQP